MKQTPIKHNDQAAQGWITSNKRSIMFTSLALNCLFILAAATVLVLTHTKSFWVAKIAHSTFQNTCPDQVATKMDTKKKGDITTNTYYVNVKALESGCVESLMQSAQLDDLRAYPDHAKASADSFRQLSPDKTLQVTTVKSLENGQQLAPITFNK